MASFGPARSLSVWSTQSSLADTVCALRSAHLAQSWSQTDEIVPVTRTPPCVRVSRSDTTGSCINSITLPCEPDFIRTLSASLDIVDEISVPEKGMVVTKIRIRCNYGLFIG